jgi:rSAM/selenodomain-associated transferase 1
MTGETAPIGLGLMCKPPRPGASKTRLAQSVGTAAAARLSRAFLEDCAAAAMAAARVTPLDVAAFYRPADATGELRAILGPGWPLVFADAGDLGATMEQVLGQLLARCPAGAMVMGADVPMISDERIAAAARILRDGDERSVVLIPSADGGYCLIGVRALAAAKPLLAPMAWSTAGVREETVRRAIASGLSPALLPEEHDIDGAADLDWLGRELAARPQAAPATRAALTLIQGPGVDV